MNLTPGFLNRLPGLCPMCLTRGPLRILREAEWKAQLLRFHDTQHQRNLRTSGHGFDARILDLDRRIAQELSLAQPYAEAFGVEVLDACG